MNKLDRLLFNAIHHKDEAGMNNAIVTGANVNAKDECGMTPLMIAAILKTGLIFVDNLVKHGADINLQNPYGNTAMMFAAIMDWEVFQYLYDHGGDINIRNMDGRTAIDYDNEITKSGKLERC